MYSSNGPEEEEAEEPEEDETVYELVEYTQKWTVRVVEPAGVYATYTDTDKGVEVKVHAPEGAFEDMENTKAVITPVEKTGFWESVKNFFESLFGSESPEEAIAVIESAIEELTEEKPEELAAYDIHFEDADGNEVQPDASVDVTFSLLEDSALLTDGYAQLQVYHIDDENVAEAVGEAQIVEAEGEITVKTENFSIYVVGAEGTPSVTKFEFYNGATLVQEQIVKNGETLLEPKMPEAPDGQMFTGWYTMAEGGEKFDGFGSVVVTESNAGKTTKLYAQFTAANYLYYTDQTGRVILTETKAGRVDISAAYPSFTVDAIHANIGWSETPIPTEGEDNRTPIPSLEMNGKDHTLYPIIKEGHWLRFDSQGGSAVESQFVATGTAAAKPTEPTKAGFTFDGWYTEANCTNKYTFNSPLRGDTTLYARWTAETVDYLVIYWKQNLDQKTYSYGDSEYESGVAGEKTKAAASKSFEGFSAPETIDQQTINGDGSTIVNVYYTRNTYTVKFWHYQDGFWGGSWEEYTNLRIKALYGAFIGDKWPANPKDGSNKNWKVSQDGDVMQSYMAMMPAKDSNFYETSQSGRNTYYINHYLELLDTESKEGAKEYKQHYYDSELEYQEILKAKSLSSTPEDHYDIIGFTYTDNVKYNNQGEAKFDAIAGKKNQYKIDFYYTRNDYSIKFISGGKEVHTETKQYQADISDVNYTPTESPAGKEDYVFQGWYDNQVFAGEPYSFSGKTMPADNITLYAKWAPVQYTVSFDLNGGTDTGDYDKQVLNKGGKATKPADPTREGYDFAGWTTEDDKPYDFEQEVTKDITLYAQWISTEQFSVTYLPGEGTGTVPTDSNSYVVGAKAEVMAANRLIGPDSDNVAGEKKVFVGWKSSADGKIYYPGSLIEVPVNGVTLTAQWADQAKTVTLTYDFAGGMNASGASSVTLDVMPENSKVKVKSDTDLRVTREGYRFLYWKIQGTDTIVHPGEDILVDATTTTANTLVAVWEQITADLTITKQVTKLGGDKSVDPTSASFTVMVELGSAANDVPGVVGDNTYIANGKYTFTLADGQSAVIKNVPVNTTYKVYETAGRVEGYIYDTNEYQGSIAVGTANSVTVNNKFFKSVTTSVSGTKTWAGTGAPDATATIMLYAGGEYKDQTTVSSSDTSYSFANLPMYKLVGETPTLIDYTVAETGVTVSDANMKVGKTADGRFVVYNTGKSVDGSNPIQYAVVGHWTSAKSGNNFTNTWTPADNQYQGDYGFTVKKVDENGNTITGHTATFTLTNKTTGKKVNDYETVNGSAIIGGLQAGTYILSETTAPTGYVGTSNQWEITISADSDDFTLASVTDHTSFFQNLWNRIFGSWATQTDDFTWNGITRELTVKNTQIKGTITVSKHVVDTDGNPLTTTNGHFTFKVKDSAGNVKDTLTMAAGGSDTTKELPYGTYTIEETGEASIANYNFKSVSYKVGSAPATSFTIQTQGQTISVDATNTYARKTGTLELVKRIPEADWNAVPATGYSGTITATGKDKADGTEKTMSFGSTGFTLENGYYVFKQQYTVPTGDYTIRETDAAIEHYDLTRTITGSDGTTALTNNSLTVAEGQTATAVVTNDYEIHKHDLSVTKELVVPATSKDPTQTTFTFTVTLGDGSGEAITGTTGVKAYSANGVYTFTLGHNQTATIENVPYNTAYSIEETGANQGGFTTTVGGEAYAPITGSIPDSANTDADNVSVTVTNTYFDSKTVNVVAQKSWDSTQTDYRGEVTVELYKNGTTTGRTETLNSTNNWTYTFENLALYDTVDQATAKANTYTVRETAVDGTTWKDGRFVVYGTYAAQPGDGETTDENHNVLGVWTSAVTEDTASSNAAQTVYTVTNTWTPAKNFGNGSFTVVKTDGTTHEAMAGVEFTLTATEITEKEENGITAKTYPATTLRTDSDGRVTFSDLPAGTYELTETKQNGYAAADPWTIIVGAESGTARNTLVMVQAPSTGNVFKNFWNWLVNTTTGGSTLSNGQLAISNTRKTGTAEVSDTITITKQDQHGTAVPGAVFALKDSSGVEIATATTVNNGEATFTFGTGSGMVSTTGTLKLVEKSAPSGYIATGEEWTVTVTATPSDPAVDAARDAWIVTTTYDAVITDASGDDALSVENTKNEGTAEVPDTITITKRDQYQNLVPGAVFALKDSTGNVLKTATTVNNGEATFTFGTGADMVSATGTLTLVEQSAPSGFTKTDAEWTVNVSTSDNTAIEDNVFVTTTTYNAVITNPTSDDALSVENTRNSYTVTVTKAVTGEDVELPENFYISNTYNDTHFVIKAHPGATNEVVATVNNGVYTWTMSVPYGTEIAFTENNYDLSGTGYSVTPSHVVTGATEDATGKFSVPANDNAKVAFTNEYAKIMGEDYPVKTSFVIEKSGKFGNDVKPLAGVTFTLTRTNEGGTTTQVDQVVTDTDGKATVTIGTAFLGTDEDVDYTFTLTETAPDGYTGAGPWTVTVDSDGIRVVKNSAGTAFDRFFDWIVSTITGGTSANTTFTSADESATGDPTLAVTNVRKEGSLKLTKAIAGAILNDSDSLTTAQGQPYTFRITAGSNTVNDVKGKTIDGLTFDNSGVATTTVTTAASVTINGLPAGNYTVTEINPDGTPVTSSSYPVDYYTLSTTGGGSVTVAEGDTPVEATITNTYSPTNPTGKISIIKNVALKNTDGTKAPMELAASKTYTFRITGTDVYGKAVPVSDQTVQVPADASTYTVEIPNLPYGDYTITEVTDQLNGTNALTGYTWLAADSTTATAQGQPIQLRSATASFNAENVYLRDRGDVRITKVFKNLSADEVARLTNFKLTISGYPGDYTGDTVLTLDEATPVTGAKDPTYTWPLENVPTGAYTVSENRKDIKLAEYNLTVKDGADGNGITAVNDVFSQTKALEKDGETAITFQNAYTRQLGNLKVVKTVSGGPDSAKTQDYIFTITGPTDANGEYKVKDSAEKVTFTNGTATITINGAGRKVIKGLPTGTYTVEEQDASIQYWVWNDPDPETAEVKDKTPGEVTIANSYRPDYDEAKAKLTITKKVTDANGKDLATEAAAQKYSFTVSGPNIFGETINQSVEITGANSQTIDLYYGTYTVTENTSAIDEDGIQWYTYTRTTGNNASVTLDSSTTKDTVEITNVYTRNTNSLTITKVVESGEANGALPDGAETTKKYTFDITGPTDVNDTYSMTVNGSTKNVTFTAGKAVVEITGENSAVIAGLPAGEYTVDEQDASVSYWNWNDPDAANVTVDTGITDRTATITNIYSKKSADDVTASLTISKEVKGRVDGGTPYTLDASDKAYTFQISGTDVYGNAPATPSVTVMGGSSETVKLIYGTYTVTEVTTSGSVPAITGYTWNEDLSTLASSSITLDENNKSGNFKATNIYDRDLETVTIGKTVAEGVAADGVPKDADVSKEYSITITADATIKNDVAGKSYSGVKYTTNPTTGKDVSVAFDANGAYTASLKHGEKLDISKLPTGNYTISENETVGTGAGYPYWNLAVTGKGAVTVTTGANTFNVTNTYTRVPAEEVTDTTLTITKQLKQLDAKGEEDEPDTLKALTLATDADKTYTFRITGKTVYGKTVNKTEEVTVKKGETSGYVEITGLTYGKYKVEEVTTSVPAITGYTWYKNFVGDDQTKTFQDEIELNETQKTGEVNMTNVYERDLGTMQVTKVFKNLSDAEVARLTNFKLTVAGPDDYVKYNGDTALTLDEAEKDPTAKHPTYTWTLTDVPTGSYTVKEARKDIKLPEYNLTVKNGVAGGGIITASEDGEFIQKDLTLAKDSRLEVFFQNAYRRQLGSLKLTKTVEGGPASAQTQTYTFTITGPEDANGIYSGEEFTKGVATVTISGAGEKLIENLPTGSYTVDEQDASIDNWTWNDPDDVTGTVENKATAEVTIANTYTEPQEENRKPKDDLIIVKQVQDGEGKDLTASAKNQTYSFTVSGKDIYGNDVNSTVTIDGTINNIDGVLQKSVRLIYGTYTVTENDVDADGITGYTWNDTASTIKAEGITLDGEGGRAVITNVYDRDTGSLTVEKKIDSEVESVGKNITFRFDVTGPKDANGTYSGVEFINGKAVVEITGEGSVTMQGLPTGKYTVTERTPEYVVGMNLAISYLDTDETNAADGIVTLAKDAAAKVTVTNEYTYEDDDGPEEPDGPKEIKDPEVPLTPVEPPVEPVDPEEPGTDIPEEPGTDIPEEETPKADAPETGDATIVWILAAAVSGIGLVWLAISGKKKKDENAE